MRLVGSALAALALLAGLALLLEPPAVSLAEVGAHEGARVAVEGWVARAVDGRRGFALDLVDGEARLLVLGGGIAPPEGSLVRATGVVARDGATFALSVDGLDVLDPGARVLDVADALAAAAPGRPVAVRGVHQGGWLRDGDAGLPLDGEAPEGPLVVEGALRLDRAHAQWRLEVRAWIRG